MQTNRLEQSSEGNSLESFFAALNADIISGERLLDARATEKYRAAPELQGRRALLNGHFLKSLTSGGGVNKGLKYVPINEAITDEALFAAYEQLDVALKLRRQVKPGDKSYDDVMKFAGDESRAIETYEMIGEEIRRRGSGEFADSAAANNSSYGPSDSKQNPDSRNNLSTATGNYEDTLIMGGSLQENTAVAEPGSYLSLAIRAESKETEKGGGLDNLIIDTNAALKKNEQQGGGGDRELLKDLLSRLHDRKFYIPQTGEVTTDESTVIERG